jgi:hypothetical protein
MASLKRFRPELPMCFLRSALNWMTPGPHWNPRPPVLKDEEAHSQPVGGERFPIPLARQLADSSPAAVTKWRSQTGECFR